MDKTQKKSRLTSPWRTNDSTRYLSVILVLLCSPRPFIILEERLHGNPTKLASVFYVVEELKEMGSSNAHVPGSLYI
jgi:hypothetical protein